MKILNLFAGIGGNRTLWGDKHEITAVEYNQQIAMIYLKRFPNDKIIIGDAYQYFLDNFTKFNFVWASPPCTTHTKLIKCNVGHRYKGKNYKVNFPDLRLYSLILFLKHNFRGKWVVENVNPYYDPLIKPTSIIGRHFIWSNYKITKRQKRESNEHLTRENYNEKIKRALSKKKIDGNVLNMINLLKKMDKKQIINNCLLPEDGKYILDSLNTITLENWIN